MSSMGKEEADSKADLRAASSRLTGQWCCTEECRCEASKMEAPESPADGYEPDEAEIQCESHLP